MSLDSLPAQSADPTRALLKGPWRYSWPGVRPLNVLRRAGQGRCHSRAGDGMTQRGTAEAATRQDRSEGQRFMSMVIFQTEHNKPSSAQ